MQGDLRGRLPRVAGQLLPYPGRQHPLQSRRPHRQRQDHAALAAAATRCARLDAELAGADPRVGLDVAADADRRGGAPPAGAQVGVGVGRRAAGAVPARHGLGGAGAGRGRGRLAGDRAAGAVQPGAWCVLGGLQGCAGQDHSQDATRALVGLDQRGVGPGGAGRRPGAGRAAGRGLERAVCRAAGRRRRAVVRRGGGVRPHRRVAWRHGRGRERGGGGVRQAHLAARRPALSRVRDRARAGHGLWACCALLRGAGARGVGRCPQPARRLHRRGGARRAAELATVGALGRPLQPQGVRRRVCAGRRADRGRGAVVMAADAGVGRELVLSARLLRSGARACRRAPGAQDLHGGHGRGQPAH